MTGIAQAGLHNSLHSWKSNGGWGKGRGLLSVLACWPMVSELFLSSKYLLYSPHQVTQVAGGRMWSQWTCDEQQLSWWVLLVPQGTGWSEVLCTGSLWTGRVSQTWDNVTSHPARVAPLELPL